MERLFKFKTEHGVGELLVSGYYARSFDVLNGYTLYVFPVTPISSALVYHIKHEDYIDFVNMWYKNDSPIHYDEKVAEFIDFSIPSSISTF